MAALVGGLVLACYWPALHGGFVWDDQAHVTSPDLRSWAGLGRIWWEMGATQQYYPVLHSAFWIEHRLWGDATLGYHLVNLLWHVTSCCLLALLLRRLWQPDQAASPGTGRAIPGGTEWLAALIFAVHPVCVESVAWIAEQKNTLSLVFYLLAALAYLDFESGRKPRLYWLASAFFLLALGTKTVTATLPAAILVVLWWRNGTLSWRRDVRPLMPWFLMAMVAGLVTVWVERKLIGAEGTGFDLTAAQRVLLAGRVVWFYLGKLVWPADLMFIYPHWDIAKAAGWYGWLGGALAVTAAFWLVRGRSRGPLARAAAAGLAGWLFFTGSLFPGLGFFNVYPFIFSYVADHFQYLASLGIIVTVAAGIALILTRASPRARAVGQILCGLLVAGLGFLANRQSRVYADGVTLYRATLARNPDCWMAHNNLALILVKSPAGGAEAVAHYQEALRLKPDYAEAHNNLAAALADLPGRESEAIEHCEQALRIHPDFAEAHCNLANVLMTLPGRESEALPHYEEALRLKPDDAEIHYSLANALARLPGRVPEALAHYEEALRIKPDYFQAHMNLANELSKLPGHLPEALAHYEQALQIDPRLAEGHYNLAVQLANLPGREAEAIAHYQEALRLQPNYAKAHNNLAVIFARQGRLEEARKHWERALELNPDYEDARRNLRLLQKLQGR
jgi:tetratricopeptide (TPR) repeat protein